MLSMYSVDKLHMDKKELEEAVRHMSVGDLEHLGDNDSEVEVPVNDSEDMSEGTALSISILFSMKTEVKPKKIKCCGCCSCCAKKSSDDEYVDDAIAGVASVVSDHKEQFENLTVDDFIRELAYLTRCARVTYSNLLDAKSLLEYPNDPQAEALGLSQVGGFVWLVTYSIQHLVNPMSKPANLAKRLKRVQAMFQEIAANSHKVAHTVETMDKLLSHYRECAAWVVKKTRKAFKIESSPFLIRPEIQAKSLRRGSGNCKRKNSKRSKTDPKNNATAKGARKVSPAFSDDSQEEDGLFQVQWSPLTVLIKCQPEEQFQIFASMSFDEKLHILEVFIKEASSKVNKSAADVAKTTEFLVLKTITHKTNLETMKSELSAMMYPSVHFLANRIKAKKNKEFGQILEPASDKELSSINLGIQEFWLTVDAMQSIGRDVRDLLVETRDIVRTCYIYTTQFYHWRLTDYDTMEPSQYPKGRRQTRTAQFFARIIKHKKVSGAVLYLSLSDFTSSIYQHIVQENPISAESMCMMLDCFEDEPEEEPWGLLPGVFDHLDKFPPGYKPLKAPAKANTPGKLPEKKLSKKN